MTLPHPSLTDNLTLGRGNLLPPDDVQSSIDRLRRFEDSYLSLPVERDCLEYETERLAAAPKPHQKYFKEVPPRNLVAKTLSTMELLEIILLHADAPDVLQLQGVAKRWQAVMGGSWSLQRAIFRSPIPDTGQKFAKLNPLLFNRDNDSRHLVLSIGQKTSAPNASVFTDDDNRKHLLFQVNTSNTHATEIGHPSDQSLPTSLARTLKHPHTVKRRSGIELRISTFLKNLPTDSTSRDRQVLTIPGFDIVPMPASGSWKDITTIHLYGRPEPWLGGDTIPTPNVTNPLSATIGKLLQPKWCEVLINVERKAIEKKGSEESHLALLRVFSKKTFWNSGPGAKKKVLDDISNGNVVPDYGQGWIAAAPALQ